MKARPTRQRGQACPCVQEQGKKTARVDDIESITFEMLHRMHRVVCAAQNLHSFASILTCVLIAGCGDRLALLLPTPLTLLLFACSLVSIYLVRHQSSSSIAELYCALCSRSLHVFHHLCLPCAFHMLSCCETTCSMLGMARASILPAAWCNWVTL